MKQVIPKIIHQTFPTNRLSEALQENVNKIKSENPDYAYRFYNDKDVEDYIFDAYGSEFLDIYHHINPKYSAARIDYFRYLLLFNEGGVYLDIKASLTKPLSNIIKSDDRYILSQWDNTDINSRGWGNHLSLVDLGLEEFQNWFIMSARSHKFLYEVLMDVIQNLYMYDHTLDGVGRHAVLHTTGPVAYTKTIAPILHLHPHRFAPSNKLLGVKYSIYDDAAHRRLFAIHYSNQTEPLVLK